MISYRSRTGPPSPGTPLRRYSAIEMSDSDSEDEERVEYFYDLVDCSPDVNNLLKKLRDSSLVTAWKIPVRCRLLLSPEIDALLDPDVVDWNDFICLIWSQYPNTSTDRRFR